MRFIAATAALLLAWPGLAAAQADRGATIAGSVAVLNMESSTDLSLGAAFGYEFTRVVGLELDATVVPTHETPLTILAQTGTADLSGVFVGTGLVYPGPRFENAGGRVVILSTNVRAHIPTTTTRLDPYFVAGGGIASVRRTAEIIYAVPVYPLVGVAGAVPVPIPPPRVIRQPLRTSSTDMALTLGGGLGVRVASHLFVDADLRMFRLLGSEDRNAGRFGVGARYRF